MTLALGAALDLIPKQDGWAVEHWGALGTAIALDLAGYPDEAEAKVSGVVVSLLAERERRQATDAARASRASQIAVSRTNAADLTDNDRPGLEDAEADRVKALDLWRRRDAARRAGDLKQAKSLRDQARYLDAKAKRAVLAVKKRVAARIEAEAATDAINETIVNTVRRGGQAEDVDTYVSDFVRDEQGSLVRDDEGQPLLRTDEARAIRINEHTGLRLAYVKGDLDGAGVSADDLYEEGKLYAQAFRTLAAQHTPSGNGVGGGFGPREPAISVVFAGQDMRIWRGELDKEGLTLERLDQSTVNVLDAICGEDVTIGAWSKGCGSSVATVRRRLRAGLAVARGNRIAFDKWRRGTPRSAA